MAGALADGLPLHWAPEATAAAKKAKLKFIDTRDMSYSPDTNPVEELFGIADDVLAKRFFKDGPPADPDDTWKRFLEACDGAVAKGEVRRMQESMPERCQDLIENDGGATRW